MIARYHTQSGFALLISLIVVGVVLSVGIVILDLTVKQVRLAATTEDSENAFHAANAGMECARYWRRELAPDVIAGDTLSDVSCFGQSSVSVTADSVPLVTGSVGDASHYEYEFTWGAGNDRCTKIDMVTIIVPPGGGDATMELATMQNRIEGYPDEGGDVTCTAGSQCTSIASRGYNQACPSSGGSFGYGVVERKVLLEF